MEGLPAVIVAVGVWMLVDRWRPITAKRQLVIVVVASVIFGAMFIGFLMTWGDRYVAMPTVLVIAVGQVVLGAVAWLLLAS